MRFRREEDDEEEEGVADTAAAAAAVPKEPEDVGEEAPQKVAGSGAPKSDETKKPEWLVVGTPSEAAEVGARMERPPPGVAIPLISPATDN